MKDTTHRGGFEKRSVLIGILLLVTIALFVTPKSDLFGSGISGASLSQVSVIGGEFPPVFDHSLVNITVNQTGTLYYDVNCSDPEPIDVVHYYDNFSGFDIGNLTGIINQSGFDQELTGNHTIEIVCSDLDLNTSATFILTIVDTDNAPVLSPIGNLLAITEVEFTLTLSATDPDGDNLTFGSNSSLFTVDPITGFINFTPLVSQIGNHTINFTVFDGSFYDYEVVLLTIVRGAFCGDGSCGSSEACDSCPQDCGECPEAPPNDESDAGGGADDAGGDSDTDADDAGGGGSADQQQAAQQEGAAAPLFLCQEIWRCSAWSPLVCPREGVQTRVCLDLNGCNTDTNRPNETTTCIPDPTCEDGIQNQGELGIDCGGPCDPCVVEGCNDGVQNQGEDGIDCGGPCAPCEISRAAQPPTLQLPAIFDIPRRFPWLFLIIIVAINAILAGGDVVYVRRLLQLSFEEHRERRWLYRPMRRKLYTYVIDSTLITFIVSLYLYIFSNDASKMILFSWIPLSIIVAIPVGVSFFLRYFSYQDYLHRVKDLRMKQRHRRELLQLVAVENNLLIDAEGVVKRDFYTLAQKGGFKGAEEFYKTLSPIYKALNELIYHRKKRNEIAKIDSGIYKRIVTVVELDMMDRAAKMYPEFMDIYKNLMYIVDNIENNTFDRESDFIDGMQEISQPHILSVVKSEEMLVAIYNALVEVYDYFMKKHEELRVKDQEISLAERSFMDVIKALSKKPAVVEKIQDKPKIVSLYNQLIDLFNHYTRKLELSTKVKEL